MGGQELPQFYYVKRAEGEGPSEAPRIPATGIPGVGRQVPSKMSQTEGHILASNAHGPGPDHYAGTQFFLQLRDKEIAFEKITDFRDI